MSPGSVSPALPRLALRCCRRWRPNRVCLLYIATDNTRLVDKSFFIRKTENRGKMDVRKKSFPSPSPLHFLRSFFFNVFFRPLNVLIIMFTFYYNYYLILYYYIRCFVSLGRTFPERKRTRNRPREYPDVPDNFIYL